MDLIDSASHHIRIPGDISENLFGLALRILYLLQLLPAVRLGSRRCDIGIRAEQKYRQNLDHAGTHITETESAGCRSKNHNQKVLYHNPDIDLEGIRLVIVYGNHNNHRKYIQKQHVVGRRKQNDRVHHSESLRHQVLDRRAFLVPAPEKKLHQRRSHRQHNNQQRVQQSPAAHQKLCDKRNCNHRRLHQMADHSRPVAARHIR